MSDFPVQVSCKGLGCFAWWTPNTVFKSQLMNAIIYNIGLNIRSLLLNNFEKIYKLLSKRYTFAQNLR